MASKLLVRKFPYGIWYAFEELYGCNRESVKQSSAQSATLNLSRLKPFEFDDGGWHFRSQKVRGSVSFSLTSWIYIDQLLWVALKVDKKAYSALVGLPRQEL